MSSPEPQAPKDPPGFAFPNPAPPAEKKFPCAQCGARLDFDPASQALECPYCGHRELIARSAEEVRERDWDTYWRDQQADEAVLPGHSSEVACSTCGAVVLLDNQVAADRCPYCAAFLENQPEAARAMIVPEGILPFLVTQRKAVEAFNAWAESLWFAPSRLKHLANLGRLSGVYVPFWTFDSMTISYYNGMRGDNYFVNETYTTTNAKGESETRTRQVMRTHWTPVSGRVDNFFDDVLVCASRSLDRDHAEEMEPWDLERLEGFQESYLSGFQTERYTLGPRDGFERARERMDEEIRVLCRRDIGGDQQQLSSVQTQHVGVTFKHVLLPIWLAAYRFHEKTFQIAINARTGEVVGNRPYSWAKIAFLVVSIVFILATVVVFMQK